MLYDAQELDAESNAGVSSYYGNMWVGTFATAIFTKTSRQRCMPESYAVVLFPCPDE